MYCRNCGTKLNQDNKFCPECGEARQIKEPTNKAKMTKDTDHLKPTDGPKHTQETQKTESTESTSKSGTKKWVLIGIIAVVVCAGIIALVLNLKKDGSPISSIGNSDKKPKTETGSDVDNTNQNKGLEIVDAETDEDLLDYMGKTRNDIIEEFGPDYEEDYYNGGTFITYDHTPAFFYDEDTHEIHSLMTSDSLKIKDKLIDEMSTFDDIKEKLGPVEDGGESEADDSYYIYYNIENYDLYFSSVNENGEEWVLNVISR